MKDIRKYIDHSALKPTITEKEIESIVKKSAEIGFATVCVNPCHVKIAQEIADKKIRICAVVGFPLGANTKEIKIHEALKALGDGAKEIDMVMNISAFKSGNYKKVEEEIKAVVRECESATVKIIVETCYLSREEKLKSLEICINSGADFIKTSTGFGFGGATFSDVELFKKHSQGRIKIKAAGGIKDLKTALKMIEKGADRIGTSYGFSIYEEYLKSG